jgi:hypothetical protein
MLYYILTKKYSTTRFYYHIIGKTKPNYKMSKKSETNGNFSYFSYFYSQVNVKG